MYFLSQVKYRYYPHMHDGWCALSIQASTSWHGKEEREYISQPNVIEISQIRRVYIGWMLHASPTADPVIGRRVAYCLQGHHLHVHGSRGIESMPGRMCSLK